MSQKPKTAPEQIPTTLGGENVRGEVAGCPTGLDDAAEPLVPLPQGTGASGVGGNITYVPPSPGEGVTEEQVEECGLDNDQD